MGWSYFLIAAGFALDVLPIIADLFNAPEVQGVITGYGGPYASHWLKLIGVVTALARMRTIWKEKQ